MSANSQIGVDVQVVEFEDEATEGDDMNKTMSPHMQEQSFFNQKPDESGQVNLMKT